MRLNPTKKDWLIEAIDAHAASYGHLPPLEQPCLIWPWSRTPSGYGRISIGDPKPTQAHRYAYELVNGLFPEGLLALHHCDNPPCFNPAHIYPGTHADNVYDCIRRRRRQVYPRGANAPNHKLSEDQVRQILDIKGIGISATVVAKFYRLSPNHVYSIWNGTAWRHMQR